VSSQQLRVAAVADSRTRRPAVRRFRCPERSRKAPTRWRTEGLIGSGGLAHHPRGVMAWPRCRSTIGVEGVSVVRWRLAPLPIDGGPGARMADRTE